MVTREVWLRETSVTGRIRSTLLRRLDDAIGTQNADTVRLALSAWITDEHEDWRNNKRNRTGAIQQLYNDVGLGLRFRNFMDRLVTATCDCRAGSRVLWVEPKVGSGARFWLDNGGGARVETDVVNSTRFYSTMKALGAEVTAGTAPPDLVRILRVPLASTGVGTNLNFPAWAEAAEGNCAELGSKDAVVWIELICRRTGFDYSGSGYQGRIMIAQTTGRAEEQDLDQRQRQAATAAVAAIGTPAHDVLTSQGTPAYLTALVRMNLERHTDLELLEREYMKIRGNIKRDIYMGDDDDELLSFKDALKAARKPAQVAV